MKTYRTIILVLFAALAVGMSSKPKPRPPSSVSSDDSIRGWIMAIRERELTRMAPLVGVPVETLLKTEVKKIHLCQETNRSKDGSYSCDEACTKSGCVHAWFLGRFMVYSCEYLFVIPNIAEPIIAHEAMHEILVIHYNIGGHPESVTVNRLDNGRKLTFKPRDVIQGRWPMSPVKLFASDAWSDDLKCGHDETFIGGGGI
jgi:hypothetical protein